MDSGPLHILLVEDDTIDREKIARGLSSQMSSLRFTAVHDAVTALFLLRDQARSGFPDKPYVILLDLNLPGMNGLEFLQLVRQDAALRHIPIFVLTASDNPADKTAAYTYGIAGYLLKDQLDTQCGQLFELLEVYTRLNVFSVCNQLHQQSF